MLIHLSTLLQGLVLVGIQTNIFVVWALQTSINPFDLNIIPLEYIPSLKINYFTFSPIFNEEKFAKSGYSI